MNKNLILFKTCGVFLLISMMLACHPDTGMETLTPSPSGARAAADGTLVTITYKGKDVIAQKKNGLYYLDDDVALASSMVSNERPYNTSPAVPTGVYGPYQVELWPNNVVPYVINRSNAYDYRDVADVVKRAVDIWNMSGMKIKFVEQTSNGLSYPATGLTVFNSISAKTIYTVGLGYFTTQNTQVFVGPKLQPDDVLHEMLHIIGIPHEHQRRIRDNYIAIDAANYQRYGLDRQWVETNILSRTDVYVAGRQVDQFPFDYQSLSIYATKIMSSKTATPLVNNHMLSKKDINLVNLIANYNLAPKLYLRNINYPIQYAPIRFVNGSVITIDLKPGGPPVVFVFDAQKKRYTYNGELVNYVDFNNGDASDDLKLNYGSTIAYKPGSSGDKTLVNNYTDYWNQTLADCLDKDGIAGKGSALLKVSSSDPTLSDGLITYIDITKQ